MWRIVLQPTFWPSHIAQVDLVNSSTIRGIGRRPALNCGHPNRRLPSQGSGQLVRIRDQGTNHDSSDLLRPYFSVWAVLLAGLTLLLASPSAAQEQPARTQRITARLQAGETTLTCSKIFSEAIELTVSMRSTCGQPGSFDRDRGHAPPRLGETIVAYQADLQRLLAENESAAQAVAALRNQTFLAWDDDSGAGYAAALAFDVPEQGRLCAPCRQFALQPSAAPPLATTSCRSDSTRPPAWSGAAETADAPIAERLPGAWGPRRVRGRSNRRSDGRCTRGQPESRRPRRRSEPHGVRRSHLRQSASGSRPARLRRQGARSRQPECSGTPGYPGVHHDGKRRWLHAGSAGRLAAGWNRHGGRLPCAGGGERAGCPDRAGAAARRKGS
jgi:hypothetical protein